LRRFVLTRLSGAWYKVPLFVALCRTPLDSFSSGLTVGGVAFSFIWWEVNQIETYSLIHH